MGGGGGHEQLRGEKMRSEKEISGARRTVGSKYMWLGWACWGGGGEASKHIVADQLCHLQLPMTHIKIHLLGVENQTTHHATIKV